MSTREDNVTVIVRLIVFDTENEACLCQESGAYDIVEKEKTTTQRPVSDAARRVKAGKGTPSRTELGFLLITWTEMALFLDWPANPGF